MELTLVCSDDQLTHVALTGRLDLAGVQKVELRFTAGTASRRKPAIVDLAGVEYMASLGVRMLLGAAKALAASGTQLVLLNPQPQVLQVLQLGRLDTVILVETDLARAKSKLGIK